MSSQTLKITVLLVLVLILIGVVVLSARGPNRNTVRVAPDDRTQMPDQGSLSFEPAFMALHRTGELRQRAEKLWAKMASCRLCPRQCRVNRLAGQTGFCRAPGTRLYVAAAQAHFGEERPLVGWGGSGTIFFSHCALRCVFCINWQISHEGRGEAISVEELAEMMLMLQRRGVHNINLVTPNHVVAHIVKALDIAGGKGLSLPIVFNTCGFIPMETLELLDGIIDIYLPDIKFWSAEVSGELASGATSYPEVVQQAIIEMHRQVGIARPDADGLMRRGLIVRHLVMPNDKAGSIEIMEWMAEHLPLETYINIMSQYRPTFRAHLFPDIARALTGEEYRTVVERAQELGFTNLDIQGFWWIRN